MFDVLTNKEVGKIIWATLKREMKDDLQVSATFINTLVQKAAENVIK